MGELGNCWQPITTSDPRSVGPRLVGSRTSPSRSSTPRSPERLAARFESRVSTATPCPRRRNSRTMPPPTKPVPPATRIIGKGLLSPDTTTQLHLGSAVPRLNDDLIYRNDQRLSVCYGIDMSVRLI